MKITKATACPLDCYDACGIVYEDDKIHPLRGGYTQGFLCPHMNHYNKYKTIKKARYKGKEITLDEALFILKDILVECRKNEILHYKSSGNFALMQDVVEYFFSSFGAVLTGGSLCDGAGEAGIINGRGSNKNMTPQEIEKSEVFGEEIHMSHLHIFYQSSKIKPSSL